MFVINFEPQLLERKPIFPPAAINAELSICRTQLSDSEHLLNVRLLLKHYTRNLKAQKLTDPVNESTTRARRMRLYLWNGARPSFLDNLSHGQA